MKSIGSIQRTGRFAGIAYFVIIVTSVLSISLGASLQVPNSHWIMADVMGLNHEYETN